MQFSGIFLALQEYLVVTPFTTGRINIHKVNGLRLRVDGQGFCVSILDGRMFGVELSLLHLNVYG